MCTTIRSHAFFVGNLPQSISQKSIENIFGAPVKETGAVYNILCSLFHKSVVDSMIEAEGQFRPSLMKAVHHYQIEIDRPFSLSFFNERRGKLEIPVGYKMTLCKLHIYTFPFKINLMAIEIDDSGSDFRDLIYVHSKLRELPSRWREFPFDFMDALSPLLSLVNKNCKSLVDLGNKFKIFQVIQLDPQYFSEEHLYEAAVCLPTPISGGAADDRNAPSESYYNLILNEYLYGPYKNWLSLALVDSFTALFKDDFDEKTWFESYYRLIYLRLLVQKSFVSYRNTLYRNNKNIGSLMRDLAQMKRYYFYDNISYNFLPSDLNKMIGKGLDIHSSMEELSTQVQENETRSRDILIGVISAFAGFSIANDLSQLLHSMHTGFMPSYWFLWIANVSIIYVLYRLLKNKSL